jgi:hypothetical protein
MPSDVFNYIKNPIYLDPDWTIVRNYDEFIWSIKEFGIPDVISFDHDLADEHYGMQDNIEYGMLTEKTGYHCAQWFIYYCIDNKLMISKKVYIHSMNPAGSKNIESLFRTYEKLYRGT